MAGKRRLDSPDSRPPSIVTRARGLLAGLSDDLAAAAAGGEVHGARRRIKRLRSLTLLVRPVIGKVACREANRHLKTAADALAGLRRTEALMVAVDRLTEGLPRSRTLHDLLRDHRAVHTASAAPDQALDTARVALATATAAIDLWTLPEDEGTSLVKPFAATYRKTRTRLRSALKSGGVEELHGARKLVIHHLHHLELLSGHLPEDPASRIGALNALREALGDLNDLAELEMIAKNEGQALSKDLHKAIRTRRKKLLKQARKAWYPLFALKTKAFMKRIGTMPPPVDD